MEKFKQVLYTFVLMTVVVIGLPALELFAISHGGLVVALACLSLVVIAFLWMYLSYFLLRMVVHAGGASMYAYVTIFLGAVKGIWNIWSWLPDGCGVPGYVAAVVFTIFALIYSLMLFQQLHPTMESVQRVMYDDLNN